MESMTESLMESIMESIVESVMESIMDSIGELTLAVSGHTLVSLLLLFPKQCLHYGVLADIDRD